MIIVCEEEECVPVTILEPLTLNDAFSHATTEIQGRLIVDHRSTNACLKRSAKVTSIPKYTTNTVGKASSCERGLGLYLQGYHFIAFENAINISFFFFFKVKGYENSWICPSYSTTP